MADSPQARAMCGRCGENEATVEFGGLPMHGGGTPYCERCVVEVQLAHALERQALIAELTERLAALGGKAEREICGYTTWRLADDPTPYGALCLRRRGHIGHHAESPA